MRFLQLKNPWSHLRWKGRYCERDEKNWTPELLKYLSFDPKTAQKFDNGIHVLKLSRKIKSGGLSCPGNSWADSTSTPAAALQPFSSSDELPC